MEEGTSSFLRKQKYSMLKNVQGRTFLSGVFRGRAPKQCGKERVGLREREETLL